MTTIKDIIRDAIKEALKAQEEAERDSQVLSDQGIESIVNDAAEYIKTKIVG